MRDGRRRGGNIRALIENLPVPYCCYRQEARRRQSFGHRCRALRSATLRYRSAVQKGCNWVDSFGSREFHASCVEITRSTWTNCLFYAEKHGGIVRAS